MFCKTEGYALAALLAVIAALCPSAPARGADDAVERGAYVFAASGCMGCHTREKPKGAFLAGGRKLDTPFGAFYTPNITPDRVHGIGDWSFEEFAAAMRDGETREGSAQYPAFPYSSYTGMTDDDLRDLWAYLGSVAPVAEPNRGHDLSFPFSLRFTVRFWRLLYFEPVRFEPDPARSAAWNRGAYLVRVLGHCGECHTPRGMLGGLDEDREMAGNLNGPEGKRVSNITPHPDKGIGAWSESDIVALLKDGSLPDGDFVGGAMTEVVENSTSKMTEADLRAIAVYLKALAPLEGP